MGHVPGIVHVLIEMNSGEACSSESAMTIVRASTLVGRSAKLSTLGPVGAWSQIYDRHILYVPFTMVSVRNGKSDIRNETMEVNLKGKGEE